MGKGEGVEVEEEEGRREEGKSGRRRIEEREG